MGFTATARCGSASSPSSPRTEANRDVFPADVDTIEGENSAREGTNPTEEAGAPAVAGNGVIDVEDAG